MAEYYTKDWKEALDRFSKCVEKDLAEIRKEKAEVQRMKLEVADMVTGKYIRDNNRIVISAPEIIIGNVDFDGMLKGSQPYSRVIIRSNDIDIEGSSSAGTTGGGSITQKASTIKTIAVDPGIDGNEAVVGTTSAIIQQARSISLNTNNAEGAFTMAPAVPFNGITLNSDSSVSISATPSNDSQTKAITATKSVLANVKSTLQKAVADKKKEVETIFDKIEKCLDEQEGLTDNNFTTATSITSISEANEKLDVYKRAVRPAVAEYIDLLSRLAEVNRQTASLDKTKNKLSTAKAGFKTKSNGSTVTIVGETINLTSKDGDGNLRTNKEAAINMQAQTVNVSSMDEKGALMEKGKFNLQSKNINLTTADNKAKDAKNADNPAVGDINIVSKNINVQAVDYETKDSKLQLKDLTKGGKLSMRIENVEVIAADKEGKATGTVNVNAKAIEIKSMDVDKEKLTDKQMAAGSTMVMVSEKMWQGSKDSKNKSKQFQVASEKVAVIAKTTAEIQQDKAVVQLDGGNLQAGGSKTALFGETIVNGKTEFKADVKAGKASIDNVEAKCSLKSANITDGIPVPAPPSVASLNAKLKEEEAPKK